MLGNKSGMFRFNPGKQRKIFPDYNPYTIKRCNDCDLARGEVFTYFYAKQRSLRWLPAAARMLQEQSEEPRSETPQTLSV